MEWMAMDRAPKVLGLTSEAQEQKGAGLAESVRLLPSR